MSPQEGRVTVPEGVPPNLALNLSRRCRWLDVVRQYGFLPAGLPRITRKNVIGWLNINRPSPMLQDFGCEVWVKGNWLFRCFRLGFSFPPVDYSPANDDGERIPIYVLPLEPSHSACTKPQASRNKHHSAIR